ncbi:helix-turn-helix domain-containing protein [Streptosporangium sp. NPDC002607]
MEATNTQFTDWVTATSRGLGYKTDAQLAAAIGVQQSTITRWRTEGSQPQIKHLVALARVFGMKIGPLLAMSGHVPPELLNDAELPAPAVTETVRRIQDSSLNDRQKKHLLDYWERRLTDERERLWKVMDLTEEAERATSRKIVSDKFQQALFALTSSNLNAHIFTLLSNLFTLDVSPKRRATRGRTRETAEG